MWYIVAIVMLSCHFSLNVGGNSILDAKPSQKENSSTAKEIVDGLMKRNGVLLY